MNYKTMQTAIMGSLCLSMAMCDPVHAHEPECKPMTIVTANGKHALEVISFQATAKAYNLGTPHSLKTKQYLGDVRLVNPRLISGEQ